jgi:predicted RNase H-like HicB family nuclease
MVATLPIVRRLPAQTWGETYEAAVRNAEEALTVYIETLIANGDPIHEPPLTSRLGEESGA